MRKDLPEFYAITPPLERGQSKAVDESSDVGEKWGRSKIVGDSSGLGERWGHSKIGGDPSGFGVVDAGIESARPPSLFTLTPCFRSAPYLDWLNHFEHLLSSGIDLVQLRVKELPAGELEELARQCQAMAAERSVQLLLNGPAKLAKDLGMAGIHLTSRALMASAERPLAENHLVGASCHSPEELDKAQTIGADFACLSPVRPVKGYEQSDALGLDGFAKMVANCSIPVYGLGGLSRNDLDEIRRAGGQGVAGISAFW